MFAELLNYDPATIDPETRGKVAAVLQSRSKLLDAQGILAGFRARSWAGEESLTGVIDLKSKDLTKLREEHNKNMLALLKDAVNVDTLLDALSEAVEPVLKSLNVPLPVILEVIGADFDAVKTLVEATKKLVADL